MYKFFSRAGSRSSKDTTENTSTTENTATSHTPSNTAASNSPSTSHTPQATTTSNSPPTSHTPSNTATSSTSPSRPSRTTSTSRSSRNTLTSRSSRNTLTSRSSSHSSSRSSSRSSTTSLHHARVEWSNDETRVLIDERKRRNHEYYYEIPGRSRRRFWNEVAEEVNTQCSSNYSGKQCQSKFNCLVSDYHVSKTLTK
jgi:hypothetical protein